MNIQNAGCRFTFTQNKNHNDNITKIKFYFDNIYFYAETPVVTHPMYQ